MFFKWNSCVPPLSTAAAAVTTNQYRGTGIAFGVAISFILEIPSAAGGEFH